MEADRFEDAYEPLSRAVELAPHDHELLARLGYVEYKLSRPEQALAILKKALELAPDSLLANIALAKLYKDHAHYQKALEHIEAAEQTAPNDLRVIDTKGGILYASHRYEEAMGIFDRLTQLAPKSFVHWNNAGNTRRDLGQLEEAVKYFLKSANMAGSTPSIYSNYLTTLHYLPEYSREAIFNVCQEWEKRFSPKPLPTRPQPADNTPSKRIRIGIFSDGFRSHPVGKMTIAALERLKPEEFEFFAYSTSSVEDSITRRFKKCTDQWALIQHLGDEEFSQRIRDDEIDILIDLSGHNSGNRMRTMAMQPAPILVKWVGGLINTTGVRTIDYLLSDIVETPVGEDEYYTEKLIRLPDDYICFEPPEDTPKVQALPALTNGYITFGCFNNPTKLNEATLTEWARLMHQLPESRLFLKGRPYASEALCGRIASFMAEQGVSPERLVFEGPALNSEMLDAYNRVDIALDPWPYSGGLTTCEALLMGVPVVTMPGPTFAGRHSATHLVNAGMPELVTNSWDEYRQRVIGLASDLESLSTIRTHLRDILLQSPVCDGPRFAKHFTTAMRAIWQRYCEGKAPAALTLDKEGAAQFEDEDQPVEILHPEPLEADESGFNWQFQGKIIAIDNGGQLLHSDVIRQMLQHKTLELVAFDPTSHAVDSSLKSHEGVHYYPNTTLGDGQPGALYACLDPKYSASLKPLQSNALPEDIAKGSQVLAQMPLSTIALDKIEGLPTVDWLVLDAMNDSAAILENGEQALKDTLIIQAKVAFQPSHERQPNLSELSHWASRHGFRFYRLHEPQHRSHLPKSDDQDPYQATELVNADALFLPNHERLKQLTHNQRIKLAFVLHNMLGIQDLTHSLLEQSSKEISDKYLEEQKKSLYNSPRNFKLNEAGDGRAPSIPSVEKKISSAWQQTTLGMLKANTPLRQKRHNLNSPLIVSLTSYPKRFSTLPLTLQSLTSQTIKPDIIILWIAYNDRKAITKEILSFEKKGMEIRFCEPIKSFKKIIPALMNFPDSFIATADDDNYYYPTWLEELLQSHHDSEKCIPAHRVHRIRTDKKGYPLSYKDWSWNFREDLTGHYLNFPTSVAGILYPPNSLHSDVTKHSLFKALCPDQDDVWVYWMANLAGYCFKPTGSPMRLVSWPSSQETSLFSENIMGGNDMQIRRVIEHYGLPRTSNPKHQRQ